jgi:hypothetical protein
MNSKDLATLHANRDKVVKIVTCGGESLFAKIVLVSEEDQDVIYDLISTNQESAYEKFDVQPAYAIDFRDIQSVETVPPSGVTRDTTLTGPDREGN